MTVPELLRLLEQRFGVSKPFARALVPLLDRCDLSDLARSERDEFLGALAAAYRMAGGPARSAAEGGQDAVVLVDELRAELRKMDESLRVLGAYVSKLRTRIEARSGDLLTH